MATARLSRHDAAAIFHAIAKHQARRGGRDGRQGFAIS